MLDLDIEVAKIRGAVSGGGLTSGPRRPASKSGTKLPRAQNLGNGQRNTRQVSQAKVTESGGQGGYKSNTAGQSPARPETRGMVKSSPVRQESRTNVEGGETDE